MTIYREDGSKETVYVEENPTQPKTVSILPHAQAAYFLIGTISLALTALITYKTLKNGKNG